MNDTNSKDHTLAFLFLKPVAQDLNGRMSKLSNKTGRCSEMISDAVREGCRTEWYMAINDALKPGGKEFPYDDVRAACARLQHKGLLGFLDKLTLQETRKAA